MATPAAIPLRHDRAMTFGGPRHVAAIFLPAQYQKILYEFLLAGIQTTETSNDPAMMGKAGFRKESDDARHDARHDERLDDGRDGSVWHRHSAADHSVDRSATQVSAHLKNFAPHPPIGRKRGFPRCSGLLLFEHVASQKPDQTAFEARHRLGLLDGGLRLLRTL